MIGELIGCIDLWVWKGVKEIFNVEIGDMVVFDCYIFVGMYNFCINIFDCCIFQFVNVIGCLDGKWGDDIYSMIYCYGFCECGERLMVCDKNIICGYWIYEVVIEFVFWVFWIGKVKVFEGVGYDYQVCIYGMVEYDGCMYLIDWYNKSV